MTEETTPTEGSRCRHCRNPIPAGAATAPFCCRGCEAVHALLFERGFGRYYELQGGAVGAPPPPPETARPTHGWLEPLLERAARSGDYATLELDVQGIHCAACVWLMQETFRRRPGAGAITVNPAVGRVSLAFRPGAFAPGDWLADVEAFGYRFGPPRKQASRASLDLPLRLGVSAALTLNLMIFSVSFYFGLAPADGELFGFFSWLSFALATALVAVGGWPFLRAAVAGLRRGFAHLDLPIALGILLVYATSLARMREGRGDLAYFDTLGVFVTLMLAGRFLQERLIERNRRFLLDDGGAEDLWVRRIEQGRPRALPAARVRAGDRLLVAPGELVPVDAILGGGAAGAVSSDWIDGESEPRAVEPGDRIGAGCFNAGATALDLLATTDYADSPLVALLARPAPPPEGERRPTRLWDRLARGWVAGVLAAAALGVALWLPAGPERALEVAAALLVVTCPCAIGIAIPLAQELTLGRLRRAGAYVRRDDLLDRLPAVRKLLFDKTGTLTLGRLELAHPERLAALSPEARDAAYDLAARSGHPAARAIAGALEALGARFDPAAATRELPGLGVELERAGAVWRLGRAGWAAPGATASATLLARDGVALAELALAEVPRPDARAELARLAARGYEIWLLSGDAPERVARLAEALGLPAARALGGLDPRAKAERVASLDRGDTLYLGDGVNDALAFARAHAAGTPAIDRPVMPGRSDFFLVGEGLAPLAAALELAADLRRTTLRLLGAAVVYNLGVVAAALAGWVAPVTAAVVMPASTLALIAYTVASLAPGRARRPAPGPLELAGARP